ncbi:MAG: hypothetical protein IJ493_01430 [Clostridia bacterium]|nr:hypothetical protein [Clostridia bacterium]
MYVSTLLIYLFSSIIAMSLRPSAAVCITSTPGSPITKTVDYPIELWSDEIEYPMEAISARIAHLSIIDAISAKNYKQSHDLIDSSIRMK